MTPSPDDPAIETAAKAISPYAWNDQLFMDHHGKHWKKRQEWCKTQARKDAVNSIRAYLKWLDDYG